MCDVQTPWLCCVMLTGIDRKLMIFIKVDHLTNNGVRAQGRGLKEDA